MAAGNPLVSSGHLLMDSDNLMVIVYDLEPPFSVTSDNTPAIKYYSKCKCPSLVSTFVHPSLSATTSNN
ncbi:hypothetical protein HYC85_021193 [Camellia sinensis]|uniref:Uncharacterized protein n=1 Tax=Camellia sinensis TaxID=4442 RepID=A0A7J7GKT9_CAMSI|nr:hypothetical protein HYC85_021193 [Camellia sinensis]